MLTPPLPPWLKRPYEGGDDMGMCMNKQKNKFCYERGNLWRFFTSKGHKVWGMNNSLLCESSVNLGKCCTIKTRIKEPAFVGNSLLELLCLAFHNQYLRDVEFRYCGAYWIFPLLYESSLNMEKLLLEHSSSILGLFECNLKINRKKDMY